MGLIKVGGEVVEVGSGFVALKLAIAAGSNCERPLGPPTNGVLDAPRPMAG